MAHLASLATDKRISFKKYVEENKRLKETVFQIEAKTTGVLYDVKGKNLVETGKTFKEGTELSIIDIKLYEVSGKKLAKVKIKGVTGYIEINKIRKPTTGNGTQYEDEVVDAINNFILGNGGKIDIKVGSTVYKDMAYCIKVDSNLKKMGGAKGDPKADIIICKDKNKPFDKSIYISHKKEGGPEAFQQYGGLSEQAGAAIANHKLTQKFLSKVADNIVNNKLQSPMMMKFADNDLANMSIYGPDYGKQFSIQHTQLIGQGKPDFKQFKNGVWTINFTSHMSLSGDLSHFTGGYTPVFGATFREGRGFDYKGNRYNGARVAIYPEKLMATRGGLVIVK